MLNKTDKVRIGATSFLLVVACDSCNTFEVPFRLMLSLKVLSIKITKNFIKKIKAKVVSACEIEVNSYRYIVYQYLE